MDQVIKNAENISLDDKDLTNICYPQTVKIIFYSELDKYETIDDLFRVNGDNIIILYRTTNNYGHWVSLLNYGNYIEYFDSYGGKPDYMIELAKETIRLTQNDAIPHLTYLLNLAKNRNRKRIIYNSVKLQKFHQHVNTCGRHAALRIKLRHIELHEYQKLLTHNKYDPDMTVTYLTYLMVDKDMTRII
jgi:hypothetical protein